MNNDRLRFRVWDKVFNRYWTAEEIKENAAWLLFPDNDNIYNVQIEQCTGLKDKNGKLILEGDIIELTRSRNYGFVRRGAKLEVTWNTFNCCGFGFGSFGNLTEKCASNCIVVGNIHENPEILK